LVWQETQRYISFKISVNVFVFQIKDLGTGIEAAEKLSEALKVADEVTKQVYNNPSNGYITYKKITKTDGSEGELYEVIFD
jgi:hypothetical protein